MMRFGLSGAGSAGLQRNPETIWPQPGSSKGSIEVLVITLRHPKPFAADTKAYMENIARWQAA
jgi:hypothetical protein